MEASAEALHAQVEWLEPEAGNYADASVVLYCFNASLYLLQVLKGNTTKKHQNGQKQLGSDTKPEPKVSENQCANCPVLDFLTRVYLAGLESVLTKCNSPLTVPMFLQIPTDFLKPAPHPGPSCGWPILALPSAAGMPGALEDPAGKGSKSMF